METIITADDLARRDGHKTARDRLRSLVADIRARQPTVKFSEEVYRRKPIDASLNFGRWIATCECAGAEYVTPADPVFWCCACGNADIGGRLRPVRFPSHREEIEALVLERPVESLRGFSADERAMNARPTVKVAGRGPLSRSWEPGETVAELRRQNRDIPHD
jgi:hypothetical protein